MASGEPLVVMLRTNGLSVHSRCTGQKSDDLLQRASALCVPVCFVPASRINGTASEISDRLACQRASAQVRATGAGAVTGCSGTWRVHTDSIQSQLAVEYAYRRKMNPSSLSYLHRYPPRQPALGQFLFRLGWKIKAAPSVTTRQSTSVYLSPPNFSGCESTWPA